MQSLDRTKSKIKKLSASSVIKDDDSLVSFLTEVPEPLKEAMTTFIETHPNWDQYRLIQAALSGFLVQNGIESRSINRLYFQNMFSKNAFQKTL
ncbi:MULTISPECIES: DUF2811 domain-containing protein [Prochlorococcus]|uniref:DUF2811 domain-containing protein n=1 Tax=Prochlorococcus marinus (strain SARG / CCMP1375 / SS120) TaxID=167539 RepID=Q7VAJ5_PROMA|nr:MULTISPECIES: DUF2811 domain-containing protein [Prochlorococcus]AAQ00511.1 Uncharacterized protein Pro_1467 [Prochlorococcus marinus subsp. marinus str. CCMP1375]KGG10319.1 hypothetical protein EV04_1985 [Prochlorococcus marinus str. LG]KGG22594.1 hypothetical protein EV08_0009 [Prochlorococcus marinus str. SS2]KGG24253.1 hypothetical protein EV09_0860 [Prochlorococcus marinus str. SS35]KGG33134.1 hypothetical protein EV10_0767 [Prochlorococcus marinus str. SS51]